MNAGGISTSMLIARVMLSVFAVYGGIGLIFAAAFVTRGVQRIDPTAKGAGWAFRVLIAPGAAALWPWLLARWRGAARASREARV